MKKEMDLWKRSHTGKWRWQVFGFILGGILALSVSPAIGWVVKRPVLMALNLYSDPPQDEITTTPHTGRGVTVISEENQKEEKAEADRILNISAGDVSLETAAALTLGKQNGTLSEQYTGLRDELILVKSTERLLSKVRKRHPESKLVFAASIANFIYSMNPRTSDFPAIIDSKPSTVPKLPSLEEKTEAELRNDLLRVTEKAEQLDPENAYFPLMRAVSLHAAHLETAAFSELDSALGKTYFNDYRAELCLNIMRLQELVYGKRSVLKTRGTFPTSGGEFNIIHNFGMEMVDHAALMEKAGDWKSGLALRQRALRIAVIIREKFMSNSDTMGHTLEEASIRGNWSLKELPGISNTATTPAESEKLYIMEETRQQQEESRTKEAYANYLLTKGRAAEAKWALKQSYHPQPIVEENIANVVNNLFFPPFDSFIEKPWTLMKAILGLTYLFLLGGVLTAVMMYRRRFHIRQTSLSSAEMWGIALGLFGAVILLVPLLTGFQGDVFDQPVTSALFVLFIVAIGARLRVRNLSGFLRVLLLTVAAALGFLWSSVWIASNLFAADRINGNLFVLKEMIFITLRAFIIPLSLIVVLALWARKRRIPVSIEVVSSYGKLALPIASLLMCGYIGTAFVTAHREAKAAVLVQRSIIDPNVFREEMSKRAKQRTSQ